MCAQDVLYCDQLPYVTITWSTAVHHEKYTAPCYRVEYAYSDRIIFFFSTVDEYCLESAPTVPEPCTKRTIWTYDTDQEMCVEKEGCFDNGGQEYNIFTNELGCHLWCHMIYE